MERPTATHGRLPMLAFLQIQNDWLRESTRMGDAPMAHLADSPGHDTDAPTARMPALQPPQAFLPHHLPGLAIDQNGRRA
jgi:hypothetical protein